METDGDLVYAHKEYNDVYAIFTRNRREQEKVWVEYELVPKITQFFRPKYSPSKSQFKVLAVGSNEGSFDCLFIKALFTHGKELIEGKEVTWTVVEPNTIAINEFKQRVSSEGGIFQNVKFSWINKGLEEFLEVTELEQFDLIHFIHVLYYLDEERMLKDSYTKLLRSPGCIVAAVGTEDDVWDHLIKSFKTKIPPFSFKQPTNIELSEICKRNGWVCETFDGKLDLEITEIFNDGDPIGEALLKFFFQINKSPKEKYGEKLMSEVKEFFRKVSWEKIKDGKKCCFVKGNEGILLVYKES